MEPVETEDKPVGKRRGRPRKNPLPPEGEDKPKRRRGRPRKYKPEPVELMDGTMEPPFEEPMTMEQVEVLPQYDSDAPIDVDDDGKPSICSGMKSLNSFGSGIPCRKTGLQPRKPPTCTRSWARKQDDHFASG